MLNPLPNLDDRRWADLAEEGRALIPLYSRGWTDHNVHDPGVTILELLAFVAEMDIFELNRVPDRHKRKFLSLVGIQPKPPIPARTVLYFKLAPDSDPVEVPAGTAVATSDSDGVDIPFRTIEPLSAVSGEIASILVHEGRTASDYSQRFTHGEPIPLFGAAEDNSTAFYIGLTEALRADVWTSLAFRFAGSRARSVERARILAEARAQSSHCGPRPNPCRPDPVPPPNEPAMAGHQSVRVVWEYPDSSGVWTRADAEDGTRAFTLDGTVRLKAAGAMSPGGARGGAGDLYYVRARFAKGSYDAAPVATHIVLNGVEAEQTTAVAKQIHAAANGESDQVMVLTPAPVVAETLELVSSESGVSYRWTGRADFDSSTRSDRHYTLDADAGVVRFGDGEHGLAPPSCATLEASFLSTRAEQGNLPEARAFRLLSPLKGSEALTKTGNATAATGGSPAESVIAAAGRAVVMLRAPQRAVTASDYEVLALETPGTALARVAVVPNCHPAFDCIEAPGVITVIPVPHAPGHAPVPSAGTLAGVRRYLNRRRIVGTRVEVVLPRYLKVAVRAAFKALPGASPTMLVQRVAEALEVFLHPLEGGPGHDGWPCGRDVYRSEILEQIDGVSGVDHVVSLELQAGDCGPVCGNVCVPALWLVTSGEHELRVV